MVERDGKVQLLDHEQSQKTKKGAFIVPSINYNSSNKQWVNGATGNSILIDVSDPFVT